ncbi:50S ribosomal protein L1 [Planctomycetes bacterium Pan216]|uniref:Large ribosomal subunit protein uL1 n=1 Tax=Kolteria novifilia TaxID=2527975 RepID=A0A518BAM1_9BACT|nr:50S ribosomal protein L1 [Planctomycetes bacterium Pan216]
MAKHSKRYRKLAELLKKEYHDVDEAIALLKQFATTKFDQSVEAALHLGIDPRQADQIIRGAISLPAGTGKEVRLLVFAKGDNEQAAKDAGADFVGGKDLADKIKGGWLDFDMTLATPDMMGVVGPLGRVLGPRGMMPTPKNGTVTNDIGTAVSEFKAGKIEYRSDASGNVHALVGKLSFSEDKLKQNIETFINHIRSSRPSSVKGIFIQSITLTSTMGPGIAISL